MSNRSSSPHWDNHEPLDGLRCYGARLKQIKGCKPMVAAKLVKASINEITVGLYGKEYTWSEVVTMFHPDMQPGEKKILHEDGKERRISQDQHTVEQLSQRLSGMSRRLDLYGQEPGEAQDQQKINLVERVKGMLSPTTPISPKREEVKSIQIPISGPRLTLIEIHGDKVSLHFNP